MPTGVLKSCSSAKATATTPASARSAPPSKHSTAGTRDSSSGSSIRWPTRCATSSPTNTWAPLPTSTPAVRPRASCPATMWSSATALPYVAVAVWCSVRRPLPICTTSTCTIACSMAPTRLFVSRPSDPVAVA